MTRVVHLTTAHPPFDPRIFHKECKSLQRAGYDVTLICHHETDEVADGVTIVPLGGVDTRIERWKSIPAVARKAKSIDADAYHFHDPELLPVGLYLSKRSSGAVVYDVHENYRNKILNREWLPSATKPVLRYAFPRVQNHLIGHFDAVITATEWIAEDLGHPNATTLHNYPIRSSMPSSDEVQPVSSPHDLQLVYVGAVSRSRGILEMVQLVRNLNEFGIDTGLWVVGPESDDDAVTAAKNELRASGIATEVSFFGRVDYPEIFPYLYGADIGLALLDPADCRGAIPSKLFDYMAAGLPVVASNMEGTRRYLPNQCGLIVPFEDVQYVTDEIRVLVESDGLQEFRDTGQQYIEERYSWENESEKLLRVYSDLLRH